MKSVILAGFYEEAFTAEYIAQQSRNRTRIISRKGAKVTGDARHPEGTRGI